MKERGEKGHRQRTTRPAGSAARPSRFLSAVLLVLFVVLPISFPVFSGRVPPAVASFCLIGPGQALADADYVLGPEDEISITVWDHPDLGRRTRINLQGKISFPLVGELQVSGLTLFELEKRLSAMLSDGYIVNPQVSVQVTDYRSQKIFVIGEVNSPGAYPLTKRTMLVEALAMAGGVKPEADHEIMIVRPGKSHAVMEALLPDQADPSEVITVRLRDVLEGQKSQDVEMRNLDTIFIPKIKVFYVTGEVKRPGQYTFLKGMTVLQAVSTAGGFTEKAARKKVRIAREREGSKAELRANPESLIEPGDTIVVPESFW